MEAVAAVAERLIWRAAACPAHLLHRVGPPRRGPGGKGPRREGWMDWAPPPLCDVWPLCDVGPEEGGAALWCVP